MFRAFTSLVCAGLLGIAVLMAAVQADDPPLLNDKEQLGKLLFFDTTLSKPIGQSCASCHAPAAGFADPDDVQPVSDGAIKKRFGSRNAPSAAYAAFSPEFYFDEDEGMYIGGQFWDGRAADLIEQAKGPFLNPVEMHVRDQKQVVLAVRKSRYADLFRKVYGKNALDPKNENMAYHQIAEAIAVYERSAEVNPFTSKYDYYLNGQAELTDQEKWGLELFEGKAMCSACHPSAPVDGQPPIFTDFTYDNLGVPKNWDNPFLYLPRPLNPDGKDFIDYGLGAVLMQRNVEGWEDEVGKFKVPTLRNIALTAPYGHNGFFKNLRDIVEFYNSRDVPEAGWPEPEVDANVNVDELGDLGLTDEEVDALVAFLLTLTDGYVFP